MEEGGVRKVFPNAGKYALMLSFLMAGLILFESCFKSCSLEPKKESAACKLPTKSKKTISRPQICPDAENFRLYGVGDSICIKKQKNCLSGVVYVPFDEKFIIDSLEGETKVCFWLNDRCALVKTIQNGANMDWGSNLPAYSAMRFWGDPGIVKVEMVSY